MDTYFVAGNVTVTKPDGSRVTFSFTKMCPRERIPETVAFARREAALYLESHDLLFGCTIGTLEVRTGKHEWDSVYDDPRAVHHGAA